MFLTEMLFALIIAFVLSFLIGVVFRGHVIGLGFLLFFVVLFLFTWAGGIWITPFGPIWFGVPWLTYLFVGLLIALIMAALIPDRRKKRRVRSASVTEAEISTIIMLDIFFFILIFFLIVALVSGYIFH